PHQRAKDHAESPTHKLGNDVEHRVPRLNFSQAEEGESYRRIEVRADCLPHGESIRAIAVSPIAIPVRLRRRRVLGIICRTIEPGCCSSAVKLHADTMNK